MSIALKEFKKVGTKRMLTKSGMALTINGYVVRVWATGDDSSFIVYEWVPVKNSGNHRKERVGLFTWDNLLELLKKAEGK